MTDMTPSASQNEPTGHEVARVHEVTESPSTELEWKEENLRRATFAELPAVRGEAAPVLAPPSATGTGVAQPMTADTYVFGDSEACTTVTGVRRASGERGRPPAETTQEQRAERARALVAASTVPPEHDRSAQRVITQSLFVDEDGRVHIRNGGSYPVATNVVTTDTPGAFDCAEGTLEYWGGLAIVSDPWPAPEAPELASPASSYSSRLVEAIGDSNNAAVGYTFRRIPRADLQRYAEELSDDEAGLRAAANDAHNARRENPVPSLQESEHDAEAKERNQNVSSGAWAGVLWVAGDSPEKVRRLIEVARSSAVLHPRYKTVPITAETDEPFIGSRGEFAELALRQPAEPIPSTTVAAVALDPAASDDFTGIEPLYPHPLSKPMRPLKEGEQGIVMGKETRQPDGTPTKQGAVLPSAALNRQIGFEGKTDHGKTTLMMNVGAGYVDQEPTDEDVKHRMAVFVSLANKKSDVFEEAPCHFAQDKAAVLFAPGYPDVASPVLDMFAIHPGENLARKARHVGSALMAGVQAGEDANRETVQLAVGKGVLDAMTSHGIDWQNNRVLRANAGSMDLSSVKEAALAAYTTVAGQTGNPARQTDFFRNMTQHLDTVFQAMAASAQSSPQKVSIVDHVRSAGWLAKTIKDAGGELSSAELSSRLAEMKAGDPEQAAGLERYVAQRLKVKEERGEGGPLTRDDVPRALFWDTYGRGEAIAALDAMEIQHQLIVAEPKKHGVEVFYCLDEAHGLAKQPRALQAVQDLMTEGRAHWIRVGVGTAAARALPDQMWSDGVGTKVVGNVDVDELVKRNLQLEDEDQVHQVAKLEKHKFAVRVGDGETRVIESAPPPDNDHTFAPSSAYAAPTDWPEYDALYEDGYDAAEYGQIRSIVSGNDKAHAELMSVTAITALDTSELQGTVGGLEAPLRARYTTVSGVEDRRELTDRAVDLLLHEAVKEIYGPDLRRMVPDHRASMNETVARVKQLLDYDPEDPADPAPEPATNLDAANAVERFKYECFDAYYLQPPNGPDYTAPAIDDREFATAMQVGTTATTAAGQFQEADRIAIQTGLRQQQVGTVTSFVERQIPTNAPPGDPRFRDTVDHVLRNVRFVPRDRDAEPVTLASLRDDSHTAAGPHEAGEVRVDELCPTTAVKSVVGSLRHVPTKTGGSESAPADQPSPPPAAEGGEGRSEASAPPPDAPTPPPEAPSA